jgi:hypothetical protein
MRLQWIVGLVYALGTWGFPAPASQAGEAAAGAEALAETAASFDRQEAWAQAVEAYLKAMAAAPDSDIASDARRKIESIVGVLREPRNVLPDELFSDLQPQLEAASKARIFPAAMLLGEGRGHPLVTMSAYIDLNPVRAGIVEDPREYRWCGYGEALGGEKLARKGLGVVTKSFGPGGDWRVVSRIYRRVLFGAGEESGLDEHGPPLQKGFSKKNVAKVLAKNGELSQFELLRCQVRYFSDGVVLGSRGFVNEVFEAHRGKAFHTKRKEGVRAMKGGDWAGLCTARDLRQGPIQVGE